MPEGTQVTSTADASQRGGAETSGEARTPLTRRTGSSWARRMFYSTYKRLPRPWKHLAVWLGSPKITLGAAAVIRDDEGRVLLAHHTYRRSAWSVPGGLVRQTEQPAEALVREMREELDVSATVGELICAAKHVRGRHMTLFYLVTIAGTPTIDGAEIDELRYVPLAEVPALTGPLARPWLAYILKRDAERT